MSETYGTGLLTLSIVPKTPEDGRKLTQALERLTAEDPTIQTTTTPATPSSVRRSSRGRAFVIPAWRCLSQTTTVQARMKSIFEHKVSGHEFQIRNCDYHPDPGVPPNLLTDLRDRLLSTGAFLVIG